MNNRAEEVADKLKEARLSKKPSSKLPEKLVQILSLALGTILLASDYLGFLNRPVPNVIYLVFAGTPGERYLRRLKSLLLLLLLLLLLFIAFI